MTSIMGDYIIQPDNTHSLSAKVQFLMQPENYTDTTKVEALETHMSWVFLTDSFVYKLKKPVQYEFLDFRTPAARHLFCKEEIKINQPLAGDTYIGVVPLSLQHGALQLYGQGEVIDWLVKMKHLPEKQMLHQAIYEGTVDMEWVKKAAEKLSDFYQRAPSVKISPEQYLEKMRKEIEMDSKVLLRDEFSLNQTLIRGIQSDLLRFLFGHAKHFEQRVVEGRIVEGHGDLRPEHICLAPIPVFIDRIEFNKSLRIIDIAEELSFLAMECEMLESPETGRMFINVYKRRSQDNFPEDIVFFYKSKRAFLRARLSIFHLLEKKYQVNGQKWENRSNAYLEAARIYAGKLPRHDK